MKNGFKKKKIIIKRTEASLCTPIQNSNPLAITMITIKDIEEEEDVTTRAEVEATIMEEQIRRE